MIDRSQICTSILFMSLTIYFFFSFVSHWPELKANLKPKKNYRLLMTALRSILKLVNLWENPEGLFLNIKSTLGPQKMKRAF